MKLKNNLIPSIASFFLALIFTLGCSPGSTTYYIDPANGDDENSGLKEERAWRTFNHINNMQLSAGDRVEIISPGSFDQSLILTGAGSVKEPVSVRFAPGQYDFYPDNAYKEKYQISNTTCVYNNTQAVGILVMKAHHFNISGEGAAIMYHDKMIEMVIDSCENITVSGLSFDYQRPTISEYKVTEAGEDFVKMQVHKDSKYRIENGKIVWYGERWVYNTTLLGLELDVESNILKRIPDPLTGMTFEEIEPFVIRGSMFDHQEYSRPVSALKSGEGLPHWGVMNNENFNQSSYYGMVKCIDDNVGKILSFLERNEMLDNTIIVFISDHGDMRGEHGRQDKGVPYEASCRIPFLIRWPEKIEAGTIVPQVLGCTDFLPTILGLMDIKTTGNEEGRDASSIFTSGEVPENWEDIIFVRGASESNWVAAFTQQYKLIYSEVDEPWFFDLSNDPNEFIPG